MATTNTYNWYYDLIEYSLTTDTAEDYVARVKTSKSYTIEDVIAEIASDRSDVREDTMLLVANLIDAKVRELVCQGNPVVTGFATLQPTISGIFKGKTATFDSDVNKCYVAVNPSQALRKDLTNVTPVFSGNTKESGGAVIGLVTDLTTGATDGTITPGGPLKVQGTKIKCVNADGSGIGTVSFVNAETNEVAATVSLLITNDPSLLNFICPSLSAGTYILRIETYFATSSAYLKNARVIEFSTNLIVQ